MADEDVTAVTSLSDTNNLKRKLDDLDEPPSAAAAADIAAPDSSELAAAADNNGGNVDDDSSKRPRLDEQEGENGHSKESAEPEEDEQNTEPEEDEQNTEPEEDEQNTEPEEDEQNAEPEDDVESTEPQADVEAAEPADDDGGDNDESAKGPVEENEAQPVPEVEKKGNAENDKSKEIVDGQPAQEIIKKTTEGETREPASEEAAEGASASAEQHPDSGSKSMTKKIEIPNNKVGVLIGKSGDTIRFLQINSGAKIQITRDADADPNATTRTVEILGRPESLSKAERLIKDVIAEADAGGSPSLVARGFSAALSEGSTEIEIPVPGDKVGLIIGRGGDTIRNLQTRSGARIQLIPQNVPGEQQSKEKKVKITGDKRQVESARELIKEVMNQQPGRPSQFSGTNYNQQSYPPRGPGGAPPQWGNRGPPTQQMPYDYHQRGPYPSQNQQYPAQPYGNHPYQGPPRSNYGSGGWEQRPQAHGPPHSGGGYDYYSQGGGHGAGNAPAPRSSHMTGHASGPSMAPPHSHGNYNYGQPPRGAADYSHPTPYSHTAPPAQNYGHGYGDPKYNAQAPVQQPPYGAQGYAPPQQGYAPQQQYSRPPAAYGMPSQGVPQSGYAPATATQPTDTPYQAPVSGPTQPPHQQYPYAPGPTTQPPYGSAPVTNDAYSQSQQTAGYAQPGAPAQPIPAYGQPGAQAQPVSAYGQQAVGYAQTAAPSGYGYQGHMDPSAYGYQGQADPSGYAAASAAYSGAPAPVAQAGYAQPVAAQPGYDQSAAQTGAYATAAAAAPVALAAQPQPQPQPQPQAGYPQYDASQQMYAAPR
ncbi:hypothetical protein RND81_08G059800 [Saponaria officinalis]|uniref:K Homology domain-containing protein n=1 Tax=Saponaria officinalis TaxID=3572 RepID=A0AAW1J410_SAPOF